MAQSTARPVATAPWHRPPSRVPSQEAALTGTVPVASFPDYESAADAVARLAGIGYPIEHITIVGCDLRLVEEVTGRMTTGRSALMGAISGAWIGALVAVLVGIFAGSLGTFATLLLWGIIFGAIFGAGLGALAFNFLDRGRGFTSQRLVVARRYDLHTPRDRSDDLRERLMAHRPAGAQLIDGHPVR